MIRLVGTEVAVTELVIYQRKLGMGGELLNPFKAINPDIAIVLGTILLSIFPGLWMIHTLRVMDSGLGINDDPVSTISDKQKLLFISSVTVMTVGGFRQFPTIRSVLTMLAVAVTILLPIVVALLTIRRIVSGKL